MWTPVITSPTVRGRTETSTEGAVALGASPLLARRRLLNVAELVPQAGVEDGWRNTWPDAASRLGMTRWLACTISRAPSAPRSSARTERRDREDGGTAQDPGERAWRSPVGHGRGRHCVERARRARRRPGRARRRRAGRRDRSTRPTATPARADRRVRPRTGGGGASGWPHGRTGRCRSARGRPARRPRAAGLRRRFPVLDELGQEARPPARCPRSAPRPPDPTRRTRWPTRRRGQRAARRAGPPSTRASAAVGPTRLSRTSRLWASVNRPAMDAPARCTTASTPSRAPRVGSLRIPGSLRADRRAHAAPGERRGAHRWTGRRTGPNRSRPGRSRDCHRERAGQSRRWAARSSASWWCR